MVQPLVMLVKLVVLVAAVFLLAAVAAAVVVYRRWPSLAVSRNPLAMEVSQELPSVVMVALGGQSAGGSHLMPRTQAPHQVRSPTTFTPQAHHLDRRQFLRPPHCHTATSARKRPPTTTTHNNNNHRTNQP